MTSQLRILRRSLIAAGMLAGARPAWAARSAPDPLSGQALYRDVVRYAEFGDHRTGTAGDNATTEWLVRALTAAGFSAERQAFDYPVFDLRRADLSIDGRPVQGFPVWTPRTTPGSGLRGPLATAGKPGGIAVVSLPYNPGASLELPGYRTPLERAAASGAAAVVAITENPVGELVALNADPKADPWPVPILLVAGREGSRLLDAAARGAPAVLRLEGETRVRPAHNVIARRPGRGKPIVISTPKSGWMRCAGERGSGMAIWLGLARWLAKATDRDLLLLATSGHEFHGYGGHYAAKAAPEPAAAAFWMHIGANVAAYDFAMSGGSLVRAEGPQARRGLACTSELIDAARTSFAGQPGYAEPIDIDRQRAPGEVALYHRLGYRPILGLVGGHPLHHTPRDVADVTGPAILEPVARGLQAVLKRQA